MLDDDVYTGDEAFEPELSQIHDRLLGRGEVIDAHSWQALGSLAENIPHTIPSLKHPDVVKKFGYAEVQTIRRMAALCKFLERHPELLGDDAIYAMHQTLTDFLDEIALSFGRHVREWRIRIFGKKYIPQRRRKERPVPRATFEQADLDRIVHIAEAAGSALALGIWNSPIGGPRYPLGYEDLLYFAADMRLLGREDKATETR